MGIQLEGVETALGLEEGLALLGIEVTGARSAAAEREAAQLLAEEMLGLVVPAPTKSSVRLPTELTGKPGVPERAARCEGTALAPTRGASTAVCSCRTVGALYEGGAWELR
ncbi:hypothetical protein [Myxococcus xanthus]|uniref:hypothetical protein n=1 Tax=Myxococcus xanthus TaxID=34 RepID=UPI0011273D13|nr:hypothetical protein [Myxococcus xanthus]